MESTRKTKKSTMPIGTQYLYQYTLTGISWIMAGIFELFQNPVCKTLAPIFLAISLILTFMVRRADKESNDEMSIQNLIHAQALTQMETHVLLCILAIIAMLTTELPISFIDSYVNWKLILVPLLFILVGIGELLVGINFKKYEE